jgi:hypothetical protein
MMLRRIGMAVFAAGLLTALVGAPSFTAAADEADLAALVENAKTAADHEAIAKLYDEEAAAARKKVAEHQKMGDSYKHVPAFNPKTQLAHFDMPKHCASLVKSYESAAKEAEEMAAAHRAAAKAAK